MSLQQTLDYLDKHKLRAHIQTALNAACAAQEEDPFAFLSKYFHDLSVETFGQEPEEEQKSVPEELPKVVFILGPPGSGKGTVCEVISREYAYVHLSTGDLLRTERDNNGPQAATIKENVEKGQLVSSEIVVDLLWRRIQENIAAGRSQFLLDGFPRSHDNLEAFQRIIGDKVQIQAVLNLQCDAATASKRLLARGRSDDSEDVIRSRFQSYEEETLPVLQYFRGRGIPIRDISAVGSIPENIELARKAMGGRKPQVIFVLGGPGAGKGTQCSRIVQEFGFVHLSAGDLLRAERSSGSKNADLINDYIKRGAIVPVEITVKLIKTAMEQHMEQGDFNFLIDGFPRNANNQSGWDKVMGSFVTVRFVLFFDCPEETMAERCLERGKTSGRVDDNPESIKKRYKVYENETRPIIDMYEKVGKVRTISSVPPADEVYLEVQKVLRAEGF